jgi:hypothetical protein
MDQTSHSTRSDHLAWAKDRALRELDGTEEGRASAMASIGQDLQGNPETKDHDGIVLMFMLAMNGHLDTDAKLREFVNGFN